MTSAPRTARVERNTAETQISLELDIDGSGDYELDVENGMFAHLLAQLSRHGLMDLRVTARGDTDVGLHHLVKTWGSCSEGRSRMPSATVPVSAVPLTPTCRLMRRSP